MSCSSHSWQFFNSTEYFSEGGHNKEILYMFSNAILKIAVGKPQKKVSHNIHDLQQRTYVSYVTIWLTAKSIYFVPHASSTLCVETRSASAIKQELNKDTMSKC